MSETYARCRELVELCVQKGLRRAVLSPGSRNAPLALAFYRHPDIQTISVIDERSAAFCALGMAQALKTPVALVCTSGTAAQNYGPAIAEAYYSEIPLVVFTADRPPEWIDQRDGQAIHQDHIYAPHIRYEATLPVDTQHDDAQWHWNRLINEALNAATHPISGPVHLNIPFREPFYPLEKDEEEISTPRLISEVRGTPTLDGESWSRIKTELNAVSRILLVAGQSPPETDLRNLVEEVSTRFKLPVVADHLSNLGRLTHRIDSHDVLAMDSGLMTELKPELVISWGQSLLSRPWKTALRNMSHLKIWQLQVEGQVADTFQSLDTIIRVTPQTFFQHWLTSRDMEEKDPEYVDTWMNSQHKARGAVSDLLAQPRFELSEPWIVQKVLKALPPETNLHLGNSLPVRWANLFPLPVHPVEVYSNRGTSGIDGTVSTSLGHALATQRLQVLIVGDLAFHYDHSILFDCPAPPHLRILVLNNQGGGIFGVIDGPTRQPEFEAVFRTPHTRSFQELGRMAGMDTLVTTSSEDFQTHMETFLTPGPRAILWEIQTDWTLNQAFFNALKTWNQT